MASMVIPGLGKNDGVVFRAVPAGIYEAKVQGVEIKPASTSSKHPGKPILFVAFKLQGDEGLGNIVRGIYMIPHDEMESGEIDKNTAKLKRLWMACGLDSESDDIETDDLLHADLKVQVSVEQYEGKDVNRVTDTLPA